MNEMALFLIAMLVTVSPLVYLTQKIGQRRKHDQGWRPTAKILGWSYGKPDANLPDSARQLLPQFISGPVKHIVNGTYYGIPFYLAEIDTGVKHNTPTAVITIHTGATETPLPQFFIRPRKASDDLKAQIGYTFAPVPAPYHEGVTFLLFDNTPALIEAIGQLPPEFWGGVQDGVTHCISDGEWFIYFRRHVTVVPTPEEMPHLVQRALGCYQLLSKQLQPFPPSEETMSKEQLAKINMDIGN